MDTESATKEEKNLSLKELLYLASNLSSYITPKRKFHFIIVFILMVVSSVLEVLSIGAVFPFLSIIVNPEMVFDNEFSKPLIDIIDAKSPEDLIYPITLFFIIAATISALLKITSLWVQTRVAHYTGADLSIDIYKKTLFQSYSTHISRNSSELIAAISNKTSLVVYYIILPTLNIMSSFFLLVFFFLSLLIFEPLVAISALMIISFIYLVIILLTRKTLINSGETVTQKQNLVIKNLQEGLGGIKEVILDNVQDVYVEEYKKADIPMRRSLANIQIISSVPRFGVEAIAMISIAIIALIYADSPEGMTAAIPLLGAIALAAQRILPVVQLSFASWSLIRGGQAAFIDILELLKQPLMGGQILSNKSISFTKKIELRDISFKYPKAEKNTIENLNLTILKGEIIGFVGETGSGKSTLLDIVMGLLEPNSGSLFVDEIEIDNLHSINWQSLISHVPQEIFLADTSIAENIAFGIPYQNIDLQKVKTCADRSMISKKINSLKFGYDSLVGERGVSLSGGQKQRIGIARALYKNTPMIVLDEATSALDSYTENKVMNSIKELSSSKTILMVAHRVETLQQCTRIIELKEGRIEKEGSYQEILQGKI